MKKILLGILLSFCGIEAATSTWTIASGTDSMASTAGNWDALPGVSDKALFTGTSTLGCTVSVNDTFGSLVAEASFNKPLKFGSTSNLYINGLCSLGTAEVIVIYGTITQPNDANFLIYSSVSASIANATLDLKGTGSFTNRNSNGVKIFKCAYTGKTTTHEGLSSTFFIENPGSAGLVLNGGTFINNATIVLRSSVSGALMSVAGLGDTLKGSGEYDFYTSTATNITLTVPRINHWGTNRCIFGPTGNGYKATFELTDSVRFGNGLTLKSTGAANGDISWNSKGYLVRINKNLIIGPTTAATNKIVTIWHKSTVIADSVDFTTNNVGLDTVHIDTSNWTVNGSWRNDINLGFFSEKSKITFTNGSKALITSANKVFDSVVIQATSGQIDSLVDSLQCGYLRVVSGKLKFGGKNIRSSGKVIFEGADSLKSLINANWLTMTGNDSLVFRGTGITSIDSLSFNLIGSTKLKIDSARSIISLKMYPGKKYIFNQNGKAITIKVYTAGDWDGTAGNLDSTIGLKTVIPGSFTANYLYAQNCTTSGGTITVANGYDGGGNVGYSFGGVTYTVTYDGNGNTGGTAPTDGSSPYSEGATVTTLTNSGSLVKTGYYFSTWNTQADGGGTDRAPSGTWTMPASNVVLYAKWTATTAVLTMAKSGTGNITPVVAGGDTTVTINDAVPLTATVNGCNTFVNWTSIGSVTIDNTNSATTHCHLTGAAAVTAHFTAKTESIIIRKAPAGAPGIIKN
jgi:hypothetical protein